MTKDKGTTMKITMHRLMVSAALLLPVACSSDDGGGDAAVDETGGEAETGEDSTGTPPVTTTPTPTTITDSAGPDDTGPGDDDDDDDDDDDTGPMVDYDFDDTPPDELSQVDRMGMPAINTAVISSKDLYNGSTPADDANGDFVDEIVASLEFLHGALDDDLTGAGLVPCAVMDCVGQAAPLVVPDVLHLDPNAAAGFPNGRLLADPVIDVTLAVVLLDLSAPGIDATTLAGLPLNPPENDVAFLDDFPFLAPPHE